MQNKSFLVIILFTFLAFSGCNIDSTNSKSIKEKITENIDGNSLSSYVFRNSDNNDLLFLDSFQDREGYKPLKNQDIVLKNEEHEIIVKTNEKGFFEFKELFSGNYELSINKYKKQITIFNNSQTTLLKSVITREEASLLVKKELKENGIELEKISIMSPHSIVPEGTEINSSINEENNQTVKSDSWFFFVNSFPRAMYEHPITIYLVDSNTGGLTSWKSNSWPVINGTPFLSK